ncbi:hypothetical protein DFJ73DRAFT_755943 [Zopfochytrium polystomum]|nr:hypothetical protein DFJ73DRAFT_755943 [Zopfochytrium polystomum]
MAPEQTRYLSPSHYSSRRSNRQQQQARECRTRPSYTCRRQTPSVDAPGGHTTTGDPGGCGDAHDRLQDLLFPYSFIAPIHRHNTAHGPPPFPFRTETERFLASRATAGTLFPYVSQIPAPLAAAAGTSPAEAQAALCRLRRLQFRAAHKAAKLLARREACGDSDPHTVAAAERLRAAAAALVCIEAEDEASRPRSPSRLSARRSVSATAAEAGIPVRSRAGGFDLTGPLSTWSSATWAAVRAMRGGRSGRASRLSGVPRVGGRRARRVLSGVAPRTGARPAPLPRVGGRGRSHRFDERGARFYGLAREPALCDNDQGWCGRL